MKTVKFEIEKLDDRSKMSEIFSRAGYFVKETEQNISRTDNKKFIEVQFEQIEQDPEY